MNPATQPLTVDGVSLPSTLALLEQFRSISAGRDLVDEGAAPAGWNVPTPRLIVKDPAGRSYSVGANDDGIELQPFVDGTAPSADPDAQTNQPDPKKPKPPDFWDRQANMLIGKAKSAGMEYLSAALKSAWDDPSIGSALDGCFGKGKDHLATLLDPDKLMSFGIGQATGFLAGELLNLWEVDDKSPAGEQIAKQLVSQYMVDAVRQEVAGYLEKLAGLPQAKETDSSLDLIRNALDTSACFLAAKSLDTSSHKGPLTGLAARTLIHGLPAVRATDTHACGSHTANKVAQGNDTILIEGLFAARLDHLTVCSAKIENVAGSVFYGKATKDVLPLDKPKPPASPFPAKLAPPKPPAAKAKAPAKKPVDDEATPEGLDDSNAYPGDETSPNIAPANKADYQDWWASLSPEARAELQRNDSMLTPEQRKWGDESDWNHIPPDDFAAQEQFLRDHPELVINLQVRSTFPVAAGSISGHSFVLVSLQDEQGNPFGDTIGYGFHPSRLDESGNWVWSGDRSTSSIFYNMDGRVLNDLHVADDRLNQPFLGFTLSNISVGQLSNAYAAMSSFEGIPYTVLGGMGAYGSNCVDMANAVVASLGFKVPDNTFNLPGRVPIVNMIGILGLNSGLDPQSNAPAKVWSYMEGLIIRGAADAVEAIDQSLDAMSKIRNYLPGVFHLSSMTFGALDTAFDMAKVFSSPSEKDFIKNLIKVVAEPVAAETGGVLGGSAGIFICAPAGPIGIAVCGGVGYVAGALGGLKLSDMTIDGVFLNAEDIYNNWTTPPKQEVDTRQLYPEMSLSEYREQDKKKEQEQLSQ